MFVEAQTKSVKPSHLRRSTRLTIAVPVDVSGTDALGNSFSESTRTITVNRHGGKLLLSHEVRVKDSVQLTSPRFKSTVNAAVVWLGKRRTESEPREVAVELLEPGNIWGVDFPPADWNETSAASNSSTDEDVSSLPPPVPAAEAAVAGHTLVGSPVSPPALPDSTREQAAGANGNGKGADVAVGDLAESVNQLIQTSLASFEEELGRIIKIHTKAFEKRTFGTAMESVETARKELQQATPALVQDSIAQLRSQVQKDMEEFAAFLEEAKQHATSDAVSTLRSRIAAALKALEG